MLDDEDLDLHDDEDLAPDRREQPGRGAHVTDRPDPGSQRIPGCTGPGQPAGPRSAARARHRRVVGDRRLAVPDGGRRVLRLGTARRCWLMLAGCSSGATTLTNRAWRRRPTTIVRALFVQVTTGDVEQR